jgi:hypothetical protein
LGFGTATPLIRTGAYGSTRRSLLERHHRMRENAMALEQNPAADPARTTYTQGKPYPREGFRTTVRPEKISV